LCGLPANALHHWIREADLLYAPKGVGGIEKSVNDDRWKKAAATSPQFARNEPEYDRTCGHNRAHFQVNDSK
jgi:hypothetical protein